ncbi:MAG: hypothetical protein ACOC1V_04600 [Candidatus Saliniplasma sp.]
MEAVFLNIIYFIALPLAIILIIWNVLQELRYLDYLRDVNWTKKDEKQKKMISIVKKVNKFAAIFLILILILFPLWNFTASVTLDLNMHSERVYVPDAGAYPPLMDPVVDKIGPTYDTEYVVEQMEESPRRWLPEEVERYVDIEDLTKIPGRLAVYRFRGDRYLITYTYLAPYPIIQTYGFTIRETVEGEEQLVLTNEQTILYPNIAIRPNDLI